MPWVDLIGCLLMLGVACLIARYVGYGRVFDFAVLCFIFSLWAMLGGFPLITLFAMTLALGLIAIGCKRGKASFTTFRNLSITGACLAVLLSTALTLYDFQRQRALQAAYPFESLTSRLAYEAAAAGEHFAAPLPTMNTETSERLGVMESNVFRGSRWSDRTWHLRKIHEDKITRFVNSPGFGVSRIRTPRFREEGLEAKEPPK
ncbi:MAG: hypothetical protein N2C14_19905, partial [Planctomycetales bacterium]